ncbi:hypothetical protein [Streptomyces spiralis]
MTDRLTPEREAELQPVGYYCDHSDEPADARTHHDWEFVEGEGFVFQHKPETFTALTFVDQPYLKPEDRETRCPRAVPVYPEPAVDAELAAVRTERDQARAALDAEKNAHLFTLRQRNNRSKRLIHLEGLANTAAMTGDPLSVQALIAACRDTLAASVDDHKYCTGGEPR